MAPLLEASHFLGKSPQSCRSCKPNAGVFTSSRTTQESPPHRARGRSLMGHTACWSVRYHRANSSPGRTTLRNAINSHFCMQSHPTPHPCPTPHRRIKRRSGTHLFRQCFSWHVLNERQPSHILTPTLLQGISDASRVCWAYYVPSCTVKHPRGIFDVVLDRAHPDSKRNQPKRRGHPRILSWPCKTAMQQQSGATLKLRTGFP